MSGSTKNRFNLQPQPVSDSDSLEELLRGVEISDSINAADSRSGASLDRLTINGQKLVLKRFSWSQDWLMRVAGDRTGWTVRAWESGIMSHVPDSIDHTTVGAARWEGSDGTECAVLMRDVGQAVVPDGDSVLTHEQHMQFIDRMAELHATFLGFGAVSGMMPLSSRYSFMSPEAARSELEHDPSSAIPGYVISGWKLLSEKAPKLAELVLPLHDDLNSLLTALSGTPFTFMHGDWKATNLGTGEDGRTILVDWAFPGFGPGCGELVWYLAINAARNPISKEETIDHYRSSLERHGLDTSEWWDRQFGLAHIGMMVQFGWEKALGSEEELDWWERAALAGSSFLTG